jgi:hypothetical protein
MTTLTFIYRFVATVAISLACSAASAQQSKLTKRWTQSGFSGPESIVVDLKLQRLIVSNINGSPVAEDGNGFLSLLDMNGNVIKQKWITGFDGPTGMALLGNKLYVTDIHRIRVVDLTKAAIDTTIEVYGSQYLNDAAVGPNKAVYITDVVGNAIYRVENDQVNLWLRDEALTHPNGIVFDGKKRFVVATWGKGLQPDFSTESPGGLIAVDFSSKKITPIPGASNIGNLDGVALAGQTIYFTDNPTGRILSLHTAGLLSVAAKVSPGAADLAVSKGMVFVPQLSDGRITAFKMAR